MSNTLLNCWIRNHPAVRAELAVLAVLAALIAWPHPLASQQQVQTVVEIPVPLTVVAGTASSPITIDARVSGAMDLLAVDATRILDRIGDLLLDEIADDLRTISRERWLRPDDFAAYGMQLEFDANELDAILVIPVTALRSRSLSVFQARSLPPYETAANARLALGIPAWTQYRASHYSQSDPVTAFTLRAAPAVHFEEWVLESEVRLEWNDDTRGDGPDSTMDNTRLVRTWHDAGTRLQAGQFAQFTRGLQAPMQLLGVSFDNLQADTSLTTVPALFDRPFVIDRPGTIDVYLNERKTRSYTVQPGQYEITDFPVTAGVNSIRVVYIRDDGETDEYEVVVPHTGGLLERGTLSYAVALGAEDDDPDLPAASGFVRYGAAERLATGLLLDASTRGAQTGLELVSATPFGEPVMSGWGSIDDDGSAGWAAQAGYRLSLPAHPRLPLVSTSLEYRNPAFVRSGAQTGAGRQSWQISNTLSQPLPGRTSLVVGHVQRMYHDEVEDSSFLSGTISRSLGRRFSLRMTGFVDLLDADEVWGVSITLSTRATRYGLNGNATTDLRNATMDLGGSGVRTGPVTLSAAGRVREIALDAGSVGGFSGSARAAGQRFDLTGSAGLNLGEGENVADQAFESGTYNVGLGTGLYIADGVVGLGAPMRSSFVLVRPARDLPVRTVAVHTPGRSAPRQSDRLGPVVLGPFTPGSREPIVVDIPGLPADFALGPTEYIVDPRYRSGAAITIVSSRRLYVRGGLLDEKGDAVEYAGLIVTPRFDPPRELSEEPLGGPAFTDEDGIFEVYGLIPGSYEVTVRDGSDRRAELIVPDAPGPLVVIGDIRLQGDTQ